MKNELTAVQTNTLINITDQQDIIDAFISFMDVSEASATTYRRALKQFFKWLNEQEITEPQRQDIINWRDDLKKDHKPTTVQTYLTTVKAFFKFLASTGLYRDITFKVKNVNIPTDFKRDALTDRQAQSLLDIIDTTTLKGKRDKAIVFLMLSTGMRTIEVIRADYDDLRNRGDVTGLYTWQKGHSGKDAFKPISEDAYRLLNEYLEARGAKSGEPLFTSTAHRNTGGRLTTKSIRRLVKDHLKECGINNDRLTAHSIRHTAITNAIANGIKAGLDTETAEKYAQQMAGHKSRETTKIYTHYIENAYNPFSNLATENFVV